jgi:hypothetical protein
MDWRLRQVPHAFVASVFVLLSACSVRHPIQVPQLEPQGLTVKSQRAEPVAVFLPEPVRSFSSHKRTEPGSFAACGVTVKFGEALALSALNIYRQAFPGALVVTEPDQLSGYEVAFAPSVLDWRYANPDGNTMDLVVLMRIEIFRFGQRVFSREYEDGGRNREDPTWCGPAVNTIASGAMSRILVQNLGDVAPDVVAVDPGRFRRFTGNPKTGPGMTMTAAQAYGVVAGGSLFQAGAAMRNPVLMQQGASLAAQSAAAAGEPIAGAFQLFSGVAGGLPTQNAAGSGTGSTPAFPRTTADGYCPAYPRTREGIVSCFRDSAQAMLTTSRECSARARSMASLESPGGSGGSGPGQRQSFESCADLNSRGAQAALCAADLIAGGAQVNPSVATCRQRHNLAQ